jgi:hypothetical protein
MTKQMLASAAAVILTTALLAPPRTQADEPRLSPATVTRYSILFFGNPAGTQTTTVGADGRIAVEFSYRENGRGPDLREEITLAPDGTPLSERVTGKSTFGAPVDEFYQRTAAGAEWKSLADHGHADPAGPVLYVPLDNSIEPLALMVRALTQTAEHKLRALPAGTVNLERLQEASIVSDGVQRTVALYALTGLDTSPTYVWMTSKPQLKLFAFILPGFLQVVESGWETQAAGLEALQKQAEYAFLGKLTQRLTHHLTGPTVIRNARVFDSEHARLLPGQHDVYVTGGHIAAIYAVGSQARDAATEIDAHGRVLMPTLFDMHDHEYKWNAVLQIAGGVTTGRDMGNNNAALGDLMSRIDSGETLGPRIVPLGFIEGKSQYSANNGILVTSLQEAKDAVDWYAQRGYRQIKIYNSFKPEWVKETAAYAHSRGMRVSGHVPAFMRAEQAIRDGYDELTHINQLMLNFFVKPDDDTRTLARFYLIADNAHTLDLDSKPVQDFIALMRARGTVHDTTLATFEALFTQRQGELDPGYVGIVDHLPPMLQRGLHENSMDVTAANVDRYRASYAKMIEMVGRLYKAGVPLVAGTDGTAGFTLHRELELYVKAGIPPAEALRIATWNGAKYSNLLDQLGSVSAGKRADLLLVDGDPTQNISDIRHIALVLKDGVAYYPAEIYQAIGIEPFVPAAIATALKSSGSPAAESASGK